MSRISQVFQNLRDAGKKALIPFITAGYPDLRTTEELIYVLEENGADIIELGVPFSDPMADGPTIQMSSECSLANGTNMKMILKLVEKVRKKTSIPIILMGYYNPFYIYGIKKFAEHAHNAGVDGILIVDLPPEEAGDMKAQTSRSGLDLIFLLAPTSNEDRIKLIAENASGFIYYVSLTGVTGVRSKLSRDIRAQVKKIKMYSNLPIGVGFGISSPLHARMVAKYTDAVVVGSAIIKIIEGRRNRKQILEKVGQFVFSLKSAI